jgi:integrase
MTLRWDAVDFAHGQIHVSRAKNGAPSVHPLSGVELRALRRLKREQEPPSPFVFTSERGSPIHDCRLAQDGGALGRRSQARF